MFYNSETEPDRELLKNETANLKQCADKISKQMTVEKMDRCSFVGVGIDPWPIKMYLTLRWNWSKEHQQISSEPWETKRFLIIILDFFLHCLCGPAVGCQQRTDRNSKRQSQGSQRGLQTAQWDQIPVSPLWYITHYMSFAKTQKRIRSGVFSVCFKIGLKLSRFQVNKLQNFQFLPNNTFLSDL